MLLSGSRRNCGVRDAQNFALNVAEHGFTIAVNNRSPDKVDTTVRRAQEELGDKVGNLKGCVAYRCLNRDCRASPAPRASNSSRC